MERVNKGGNNVIFPTPRNRPVYNQRPRGNPFSFGQNIQSQNELTNYPSTNIDKITTMATKGASGLSKTLGNVQQVLKVIETTAPIVQEYGPMIKNLPSLYRMMKTVNELDDESKDDPPSETTQAESASNSLEEDSNRVDSQQPKTEKQHLPRESKPRLFI